MWTPTSGSASARFDVLPAVYGGDSRVIHAATSGVVPASVPTARLAPGLAPGPQAVTARPAARIFFAALTSRSCAIPQSVQVHVRTRRPLSPIGPVRAPHLEQS